MKRIFFFLFSLSLAATAANAQSAQYNEAMEKQIGEMYKSQGSNGDLAATANTFERIAEAEKTQWLPYYYAAYCRVMQALSAQGAQIDELADQAEKNINKASALSKDNSEIACVQSLITTARINVDPMTRGRKFSPVSSAYLADAKKFNPENPRVYLLQGQTLYYTPEQFGGSKEKAKEMFELSLKKFESFKPESKIAPNWGKEYTQSLLSKIGN